MPRSGTERRVKRVLLQKHITAVAKVRADSMCAQMYRLDA